MRVSPCDGTHRREDERHRKQCDGAQIASQIAKRCSK